MKSIRQAGLLMLEGLAITMAALSFTPNAHANVYATNIKLNGGMSNVSVGQGSNVNISYILNENATAGVTVKILSGATVVRTITIASGSSGSLKGLNTVVWDGKDDSNNTVALGTYKASITAAATGYSDWTQISNDSNTNNYVYRCRALAVVKDTNSPYYGRVFVGNSTLGPSGGTATGDKVGILKFNADGSFADDGGFATGGYAMTDDGGDCPLKFRIGEDSRLYFNDWAIGKGRIVATDLAVTTNQIVLDTPNYASNPYYSSDPNASSCNWQCFDVSDAGSDHGKIWLGDGHFPSAGVWVWNMTTNGVADPNDTVGTQAVATGGDLALLAQGGIFVDKSTNIFINQYRNNAGDPASRCIMFSGFDGTNTLLFGATWAAGGGDDSFRAAYDMDGDSRVSPHYLAFGMYTTPGGIRVLNATDGSTVTTNITYGTFYRSVTWDNAGNLYAGSQTLFRWRVFSPPGANQATTVALPSMQVTAAVIRPAVTKISTSGGTVTVDFTGSATDAAAAFTLQSSATVSGTFADVDSTVTQVSPGVFRATVATAGSMQFYRIKR